MDMSFMDEYFKQVREGDITRLAEQRNYECSYWENEAEDLWKKLMEKLGVTHLFDGHSKLSPEEETIWELYRDLLQAKVAAVGELLKGAYMVGAEDRERMLR